LPVTYEINSSPAFRRERFGDALVRRAAARGRYDFILPLDADEFIVADGRAALERELAAAPGALLVRWLCYVPTGDDEAADDNPVTRIRHRLDAPHATMSKTFFSSKLLQSDDVYLADGNHALLSKVDREIRSQQSRQVFLAHFPIRSARQFVSKITIGTVARLISPEFTGAQSLHWRTLARDPTVTVDMSIEELSRHALGYLDASGSTLIEAPLATSAEVLRHADLVRVDAHDRIWALMTALLEVAAFRESLRPPGVDVETTARETTMETQRLLAELDEGHRKVQSLYRRLRKSRRVAATSMAVALILAMIAFGYSAVKLL
jgi:hypothetical protein